MGVGGKARPAGCFVLLGDKGGVDRGLWVWIYAGMSEWKIGTRCGYSF